MSWNEKWKLGWFIKNYYLLEKKISYETFFESNALCSKFTNLVSIDPNSFLGCWFFAETSGKFLKHWVWNCYGNLYSSKKMANTLYSALSSGWWLNSDTTTKNATTYCHIWEPVWAAAHLKLLYTDFGVLESWILLATPWGEVVSLVSTFSIINVLNFNQQLASF